MRLARLGGSLRSRVGRASRESGACKEDSEEGDAEHVQEAIVAAGLTVDRLGGRDQRDVVAPTELAALLRGG